MRITQTELMTTDYNILYAQEPYDDISCLSYAVDTTKWSELTYHPWMYPNEYLTGESMSGRVIAKQQGDGNNLQIKSSLIDCRNMTMVDLTIHNPFPYAIIVDCITYDENNSIRDNDRHVLTAYGDYTRHYDLVDDYYCFAVSIPDDVQYPNALVGLSQFVIYTGTIITDGFTGCKINEMIDYTSFISNSAYITGIGDFPLKKRRPFKIYDDDNNLYGTFYVENFLREADGTYVVTAYDVSYTIADMVTRGDWFEGHTPQDAMMNIFTYSNNFEWKSENGESNMRSFINVPDNVRIKGFLPWGMSLRDCISAIAMSVGAYPYVNRDGVVSIRYFDENQTAKLITTSKEIVGRKITESKHGIDRVIVNGQNVKKFTEDSATEHYMRRYKYTNYAEEFNERFEEGDSYRRYVNQDSDEFYKYYYFDENSSTWKNSRRVYTGGGTLPFTVNLEDTNCPSKRPSDTQICYFAQNSLWSGSLDLYVMGEWSEGASSDDGFAGTRAYPLSHSVEDEEFYKEWNQLIVDRPLECGVIDNYTVAQNLYNITRDYYTVKTSILPDFTINVGDKVMLEDGQHVGIITELTTDLYHGGLIEMTVTCFTSN